MFESQSWAELLGKPVDEAVAIIEKSNVFPIFIPMNTFSFKDLNVVPVHKDSAVTHDFRTNRVRVFYDDSNNVHSEPRTG